MRITFTRSVLKTCNGGRSRLTRQDVRLAILVGDPAEPGPYLIRVKLPAGVRMMPHKHPEDRIYTVMSGVFYIGLGEVFDESKLTAYAPRQRRGPSRRPTSISTGPNLGEYITQVSAIGPLGLGYVDASDDPRNHGQAPV